MSRWWTTRMEEPIHVHDRNFQVRLSELEIRGYRLLQNARLSREERQMVLAATRNDTEYGAVVTQFRSAWEAMAVERQVARFILQTLTVNGMLNNSLMASRAKEPRWMCPVL